MINKYFYFLFCFLGAFLLATSIAAAQDRQGLRTFASVDDEIRYYLLEENYSLAHHDVLSIDEKAFDRARFLARNYDKQFIQQAKEYLAQAHDRELFRLIWVLLRISGPDYRPLMVLLSADSFEATFKNAPEIRAALVRRLTGHLRMAQSIYAVEALAALKYRPAIPEIISFLDSNENRNVLLTLYALADLDAKVELATYLQQKVFEDWCIRKDHDVRGYTIRTESLTNAFQAAANNKSKYSPYFRAILQDIVWNEPDQATLAHFAQEGGAERLRGYAVLLLAHFRNDAALNTILDRLENDPSGLVRFWAAQAFVISPDVRAVDMLIAVYNRSEDDRLRFGCIDALGKIGGEKAVATVQKALNDKDPQIRATAKFRLEQLASRN